MDYLINFVNSTHSHSPPLFHFSLITTPSPSHIHFSLPVLKLIIVKKILCETVGSSSVLVNYSDVFFGLQLIVVVFEQ
jgi:hypothetical protein